MAYYIWVDAENKEIKRENKGRGRPRSDAQLREDGNYYILGNPDAEVTTSKPKASETKTEAKETETESAVDVAPDGVEIEGVTADRIPIRKENHRIALSEFLDALYWTGSDYREENGKITILRSVVIKRHNMDTIKYNGAYARIEIDTKENTMVVSTISTDGRPTFMVRNAFLPRDPNAPENPSKGDSIVEGDVIQDKPLTMMDLPSYQATDEGQEAHLRLMKSNPEPKNEVTEVVPEEVVEVQPNVVEVVPDAVQIETVEPTIVEPEIANITIEEAKVDQAEQTG